MNKIISMNKQGESHKTCEDAVYISSDNNVMIVCDGVSNSKCGGTAAHAVAESMGRKLESEKMKRMLESETADYIRREICRMINDELDRLCSQYNETERNKFASTFLACIRTRNKIVILHAGDGCILGYPNCESNAVSILSGADNSDSGAVYDISYPHQNERMRVIRLDPRDWYMILLGTDGFTDAVYDSKGAEFYTDLALDLLDIQSESELESFVQKIHLNSCRITDDISVIFYKPDGETASMKRNECHVASANHEFVRQDSDFIENYGKEPLTRHDKREDKAEKPQPVTVSDKSKKKDKKKTKKSVDSPLTFIMAVVMIVFTVFAVTFTVRVKSVNEANESNSEMISSLSVQAQEFESRVEELEGIVNETTTASEETTSEVGSTDYEFTTSVETRVYRNYMN